jgi:hypothetical protein
MNDIKCPYCGEEQEVCHDDGFGYEEDRRHEMQCHKCEKYFVFTTHISFYYFPEKADCLNGDPHDLKETSTYPRRHTKMACKNCDHIEPLPKDHPFLQEQGK